MQRGLPLDREADEWGVERERDERAERQPQPLAVEIDGDDGDSAGNRRMTPRRS